MLFDGCSIRLLDRGFQPVFFQGMRRNAIKTVETSVSTEASSKWYFSNTALVRRLIVVADMDYEQ